MHSLITYQTASEQAEALALDVAQSLRDAIEAKGKACLAVPGGSTPRSFLAALSRFTLQWSQVTVMLTDERLVPETSDRSNTRLLRETLLQGDAAQAQLFSFLTDDPTPNLLKHLPLDVCVLGMGDDMHTASLFPNAPELPHALDANCLEPLTSMTPTDGLEPRLTLSAPVLTGASRLHLLIKGDSKKAALDQALNTDSPLKAPIKVILGRPNLTIHYTD